MNLVLSAPAAVTAAQPSGPIQFSSTLNGSDEWYDQAALGAGDDDSKHVVAMWVKLSSVTGNRCLVASGANASNDYAAIVYRPGDSAIYHEGVDPGSGVLWSVRFNVTLSVDTWYHLLASFDSDEATDTNRIQMRLDGNPLGVGTSTWPALGISGWLGSNVAHNGWGRRIDTDYLAGNLAQALVFSGGSLQNGDYSVTDFFSSGAVDVTGLARGTNGSLLMFSNGAAMGEDEGAGTNDWTPNNIDASNRSTDVPT